MFENFPYTDMHQLNLDWIIKIAKDFLDQYTHLQQLITDGEASLQNLTDEGVQTLVTKTDQLETLLNEWYDTHSADIANQLADALNDLNAWYTLHQNYLDETLTLKIAEFNTRAEAKGNEVIESIPADYTALQNEVRNNMNVSGFSWVLGHFVTDNGEETFDNSRACSSFIPCPENMTIQYSAEVNHAAIAGISFYDKYYHLLRNYKNNGASLDSECEVTSPVNTAFCKLSIKQSQLDTAYIHYDSQTNNGINNILSFLEKSTGNLFIGKFDLIVGKGIYSDGVIYDDAARCITSEIRITPNTPLTYIAESNHTGIYGISFYDSDHNLISGIANNALSRDDVCFVYAPLNTHWVRLSIKTDQIDMFFISQSELLFKPEKYAVVSTSGSDSTVVGNGSFARPYASVGKALQMGFRKILMAGGYYDEVINLNNIYDNIELVAFEPGKAPVFRPSESLITTTETKASGYNKVYYCSYTGSFASTVKWLFQDGYADRATAINESERLPLERGLEYRCNDTLILKCDETTLASALDEIDAYDGYKWFFDANNNRLYYSRPTTVNNVNPIRRSTSKTLFTNNHPGVSLKLTGINAKYMSINLNQSCNSIIADCRVENAYNAGAFTYDNCVNIQFIRCEASRCDNGSTGDGFNGHGSNDYDKHTKTVTATLIDCWGHDNNDDGYSDHEFSETTIIGGLFEFNGKGGVTPSYGSHCTCYNVISRFNKNGFYCVGDVSPSEGGKYTQLLCFDCFAFGNNSRAGFRVDGTNNRVILHNCTARANTDGYRCETGCKMDLFDCRAGSNEYAIADIGNGITIRNNEIVTNA